MPRRCRPSCPVARATLIALSVLSLLTAGCSLRSGPANSTTDGSSSEVSPAQAESSTVAGRLVVFYRGGAVPQDAASLLATGGVHLLAHTRSAGFSTVQVDGDEAEALERLSAQPEVEMVLRERRVTAVMLPVSAQSASSQATGTRLTGEPAPIGGFGHGLRPPLQPRPAQAFADTFYDSPQGWAVQASGGFGDGLAGGPALGPWNLTQGTGIRVAVLDSGIDATHPDLAPNLALGVSEVDTLALPSPCDDGSPQDQQGHGSWTASLAAGALGGGAVVGVAPRATLLNIKVLERLPAASPVNTDAAASCAAGEPGGLLSWVLAGIAEASAAHADVILLSLGSLVNLDTGDGAGWKTQFDRAAYAAEQSGAVVVAALGNDGLDLSSGPLLELPAQARGVLAVTAATNPACAEDRSPGAVCHPGAVALASYSSFGAAGAVTAPGGNLPEGANDGVSGFVRGACSSGLPGTGNGLPAIGGGFGCFGLGHQPYVQAMGTSASAALVTGAAALLRAAHPEWTPEEISAVLRSSAASTAAGPQLDLPSALLMR